MEFLCTHDDRGFLYQEAEHLKAKIDNNREIMTTKQLAKSMETNEIDGNMKKKTEYVCTN